MNLSWDFKEFNNLILARSSEAKGIIQISTAFKSDFLPSATIEEAEGALREFAGLSVNDSVEISSGEVDEINYGYFDLTKNSQKVRYWYLIKPEGLILATYQSKESNFDENELQDSELILFNSRF